MSTFTRQTKILCGYVVLAATCICSTASAEYRKVDLSKNLDIKRCQFRLNFVIDGSGDYVFPEGIQVYGTQTRPTQEIIRFNIGTNPGLLGRLENRKVITSAMKNEALKAVSAGVPVRIEAFTVAGISEPKGGFSFNTTSNRSDISSPYLLLEQNCDPAPLPTPLSSSR